MVLVRCRSLPLVLAWGLCLCLVACRDAPAPVPEGLAGLRFGDAPGAGLTPLRVPLPEALVGALTYFGRPGPAGTFYGAALTDPVFAFWRGRLFSVAARLADPQATARLGQALDTAYGPALDAGTADGETRLWRLTGVDVALTQEREGGGRLLVRSRDLARELAQWRIQAVPLEGEAGN